MSRPRTPNVVGVSGGVGTTTVATALRGRDRGRVLDKGTDVLVCRSTAESLRTAAGQLAWLADAGSPLPVLAVTSDGPLPLRGQLVSRLRTMEPRAAALVLLPYVAHWRELTDPLSQVARLSGCTPEQLPRTLRDYGRAVQRLAEALLASDLLRPSAPAPQPNRPGMPQPRPVTEAPLGRDTDTADAQPNGISNFSFAVSSAVPHGGAR